MPVNEEIESISLHNLRPLLLHGYVAPFLVLYSVWLYVWAAVYGIQEHKEAGLIALAIIGLLQILTCLFCHWSVYIRAAFTCSKATDPSNASVVKVVPTANNGSAELVRLVHQKKSLTNNEDIWFIFQKAKYVYDREEKKEFRQVEFPVDLSVKEYMEAKGFVTDDEYAAAENKYGKNELNMDLPKFAELFKERATAPFFVFQVFCVGLWCLDDYWYYSVFTLFMLVMFEFTLVQQQLRNMSTIREMGTKPYSIQVYRNRKWRHVQTDQMVPGDIVSICRSQEERLVPCDLLLLRGSCITDESMLTGESVPVMKEPMENLEGDHILDLQSDGKLHILSGGTKVVQHSPPNKTGPGLKASDNGCIAYVLRTGFNTSQGRLLRTILYSVKRVTANNLEAFAFIMVLMVFAVIASSYVWIKGSEDPNRNRYKLFLECTLILTSVVPPELPIELSLAVNTSLLALTKLYVYCTEPFRIPFAGKIDICCFDKTGTLTSDNLVVEGVAGLNHDNSEEICPVDTAPLETIQVLATCHALVQLDDEMVGDPLEKATLSAVDWTLTKGEAVIPRKMRTHGLKIFHRFHFASALKRMSVIAGYTPPGSVDTHYIASVKGAPETLRAMFSHVPADYDEVYFAMARRGARVLALGYKPLGCLSHQQVRDINREKVENELKFVGFVIISCPLKSDSKSVIKELQLASHHVVMITGDNPLTACHVAKQLRMVKKSMATTLILTGPNEKDRGWHWQSIDDSNILGVIPSAGKSDLKDYDLCVTGEALTYLYNEEPKFFKFILPCIKVYARVAPKQKEFVITSLKQLGYVTLMCGDGTNDVGALKHAEVGVALLANAPEKLPEKRRKAASDESNPSPRHQGDGALSNPQADKLAQLQSRGGKPIGRAAKSRAVARGENLAPAQRKLQDMLKELEDEQKSQLVKLGDASIASPFTSKLANPTCVCHIIKQGRCTLVTTLQMFKILALNALVLAYSQSVLYLDGIRFSDTQATVQGLLLAGCFLFISRSKPLKVLSRQRPLPNIFNVYTMLTVLLQFACHFAALIYLAQEAMARSPPREEKFIDLEKKFEPSLLNTTVYIISISLQVVTFAVNYKGHPFMESLIENKPLLYSIFVSGGTIACIASGVVPEISDYLEFVILPDDLRNIVLPVLVADFIGCLLLDRSLQFLFGQSKMKRT